MPRCHGYETGLYIYGRVKAHFSLIILILIYVVSQSRGQTMVYQNMTADTQQQSSTWNLQSKGRSPSSRVGEEGLASLL